jgi:hypothetical protein
MAAVAVVEQRLVRAVGVHHVEVPSLSAPEIGPRSNAILSPSGDQEGFASSAGEL